MKELECYSQIFCFGSEYFDTMLSHPMKEKETSSIELPDKTPEDWKLFYEFIDPSTIVGAKVTMDNVLVLAPQKVMIWSQGQISDKRS